MSKSDRSHKVTIEIPERKYRRYYYPDKNNKRIIVIDLRCIRASLFHRIDYGGSRKYIWKNPEQLQQLVEEYFESCYGPIRNPKTGEFFMNADGTLAKGQNKPFTISGLALYCHVDSRILRGYSRGAIDSLGFPTEEDYSGPSYSEIIFEARKRIETYAEEQLYSRDGFGGGKFVLDCAFNWVSRKEKAEIKAMQAQTELKKKELKFKKKQAAIGEDIDEPVTITIRRAGMRDEED